jgi:hypothetical protein
MPSLLIASTFEIRLTEALPIEPRDFMARIEPFLGRGETAGESAGGSP